MGTTDYDAIVIGAGCGGISCGALLAKKGMKTLVLEQNDIIGGCCSTFEDEGFHFDTGASIVEMPGGLDVIFERLGRKREDYMDLRPCEPMYSFRTPEGNYLDIPTDFEAMYELIKSYSPEDAEGWREYCAYWKVSIEEGMNTFLHSDMQSWKSMMKMSMRSPKMIKYMSNFYLTYEILIKRWFKHQTTLDSLGFQSFWIGLPPRLCPGLYAGITYSEHEGIYYPMGGMISVPQGILNVGQEYGLELRLDTEVTKVIVQNGKARGVVLKDGTKLSAKVVVSNINAKVLYLDLIGEEHLPARVKKGVESYKLSLCMPMIYLGIKGDVPLRAHHNLQLGRFQSMNENWEKYFLAGRFPDDPVSLVAWPTEADPSLAPEGHHVVTVGAMGSYKLDHGTWDERGEEYTDLILGYVDKTLWPGIRDQIVYQKLSTPVDFERRLLSPEGAVYALQNDIPSTMIFRPSNKSKSIEGLYLTGASTHPGGGVVMTIASGGISADLIEKDLPSL